MKFSPDPLSFFLRLLPNQLLLLDVEPILLLLLKDLTFVMTLLPTRLRLLELLLDFAEQTLPPQLITLIFWDLLLLLLLDFDLMELRDLRRELETLLDLCLSLPRGSFPVLSFEVDLDVTLPVTLAVSRLELRAVAFFLSRRFLAATRACCLVL